MPDAAPAAAAEQLPVAAAAADVPALPMSMLPMDPGQKWWYQVSFTAGCSDYSCVSSWSPPCKVRIPYASHRGRCPCPVLQTCFSYPVVQITVPLLPPHQLSKVVASAVGMRQSCGVGAGGGERTQEGCGIAARRLAELCVHAARRRPGYVQCRPRGASEVCPQHSSASPDMSHYFPLLKTTKILILRERLKSQSGLRLRG